MTTVTFYNQLTWMPQTRQVPGEGETVKEEATFALYMNYRDDRFIFRDQSLSMVKLINAAHGDQPGDPDGAVILRLWHRRGALRLPSEIGPEEAKRLTVAQIDYHA